MDVRVLQTFAVVAARRSFTVAAEELFLTQSAVSQQIRALESELGVSLFSRSRTTTELTAAGRSLLPRAEAILTLAREMKAEVAPSAGIDGRLRIAAETVASAYLYVELYERFASAHPDVALEIGTGLGTTALERVASGDADVAFVTLPAASDKLDFDELGDTEIVVVATRDARPASDARTARYVVWDGSRELDRFIEGRRDMRIVARTNDLSLIKRFIDRGLGFAFVPRWSVREELASGALEIVATGFPTIRQHFGIGYRRGEERSATVAAFLRAAGAFRESIAEHAH